MELKVPFAFTAFGRNWKNRPISVSLMYHDGHGESIQTLQSSHLSAPFSIFPSPVSGYYMDGGEPIRITNLVGYNGSTFIKHCPHCGKNKSMGAFDYSGRTTGEQRDQSNCSDCRSSY